MNSVHYKISLQVWAFSSVIGTQSDKQCNDCCFISRVTREQSTCTKRYGRLNTESDKCMLPLDSPIPGAVPDFFSLSTSSSSVNGFCSFGINRSI